jgi:hypothetical protein
MRQTARKGMAWHPPTPLVPIPKSPSKSDTESNPMPWAEDSSDDEIDYVPAGPEIELPELEASTEYEVQILEPPPIPVVDLVSEDNDDDEEVEILEPPPVPIVDLIPEEKEEVALPFTPSLEEVDPTLEVVESMTTSEDTEDELEILVEFDKLTLSFEESRELAKTRGKRVIYWGKMQRPVKRTRIEPNLSPESSPSPERSNGKPDPSG